MQIDYDNPVLLEIGNTKLTRYALHGVPHQSFSKDDYHLKEDKYGTSIVLKSYKLIKLNQQQYYIEDEQVTSLIELIYKIHRMILSDNILTVRKNPDKSDISW